MGGFDEIPRFQLMRIEMLRDEIKFLEQMESWGASLFLGGIALIAKQIIDWDAPAKDSALASVCLYWPIRLLPALIGLVAFGFLRTVNFRIRGLRDSLYQLVPLRNDGKKRSSCGSVGWWMAAMPLLFGAMASAYLIRPLADAHVILPSLFGIELIAVGVAIACFRRSNNKKGCTPSPQ